MTSSMVVSVAMVGALLASSPMRVAAAPAAVPSPEGAPTQQVNGPAPAGDTPGEVILADGEVPALRTANARVFKDAERGYRAEVSSVPVNYRAGSGAFEKIDDRLVADDTGWHNAANAYTVHLPASLAADAGVQITSASGSASFVLRGASGAGEVDGAGVRYRQALPGLDAAYVGTGRGVEEILTVSDAAALASVSYDVTIGGGLAAVEDGGAILLKDRAGVEVLRMPRPVVDDAAGAHSNDGALRITAVDGNRLQVALDVPREWLAGRVWPLRVDPGISTYLTDTRDCTVSSAAPTTSSCNQATFQVGKNGTDTRRGLVYFPMPAIPGDSVVSFAYLSLKLTASSNSTSAAISAYPATRAWTTAATWNKADASTSWTTAGGDFGAEAAARSVPTGGSPLTFYTWTPSKLVQGWIDGSVANNGLVVKQQVEGTANLLTFAAGSNPTSGDRPIFYFYYTPRLGSSGSTFVSKRLTDRAGAKVNVANGNLVVEDADVSVATAPGGGIGAPRVYNSLSTNLGCGFGGSQNWGFGTGPGSKLYLDGTSDDPSVHVIGSGGESLIFRKNGTAWTPPVGVEADLAQPTSTTFTLTQHGSGRKTTWTKPVSTSTNADLTSDVDRDGNGVTHSQTSASPYYWSMTDSASRQIKLNMGTGGCGIVSSVTDVAGSRTWTYTYTSGLLTSVGGPSSTTTTYGYDASSRLTQITSPGGRVTKIGYVTGTNKVATITQVNNLGAGTGPTTSFSYTSTPSGSTSGQTVVTDPNSHATTYLYNTNDVVLSVTDANGHARTGTYTPEGRPLTVAGNSGSANSTLSYDTDGNALSSVARSSNATAGTGVRTGVTSLAAYDPAGQRYQPASATDPGGNCTAVTYNTTGNVIKTNSGLTPAVPGGGGPANCNGGTGGLQTSYGLQGDLNGGTTITCGAKTGQVCTATDGNGNVTTYAYNTAGLLTGVTPPAIASPGTALGASSATYDALGRRATSTDGKAQTTRYSYDSWDRIKQVLYNGTTTCDVPHATCIEYVYDNDGYLTSRVSNAGTTTYAFDELGRLTAKTQPGTYANACSGYAYQRFTYDDASNLLTFCDGGGTVTYRYDNANQLLSVQEPGGNCTVLPVTGACTTFDYNDISSGAFRDGKVTKITYPPGTGVVTSYSYDDANQLTRINAVKSGTTTLQDQQYTYHSGTLDKGLVQSVTGTGGPTLFYKYDAYNQLCWASPTSSANTCSSPPTSAYGYTYDPAGNRLSAKDTAGATTYYRYNAGNQLCRATTVSADTCATGYNATYDANGNELTAPSAHTSATAWGFNAKNQTSTFWTGSYNATRSYADADSSELILEDGTRSYADTPLGTASDSAGTTKRFYTRTPSGGRIGLRQDYGTGVNNYYYLTDNLGSTIKIFDASGTVGRSYTYDPWGKELSATGSVTIGDQGFRWAGGWYELSNKTYRFGTRNYDPALGRWTQLDPSGADASYVYVGNNPVSKVDPTGRYTTDIGYGIINTGTYSGSFYLDRHFTQLAADRQYAIAFVGTLLAAVAAALCASAFCGVITELALLLFLDAANSAASSNRCAKITISLVGTVYSSTNDGDYCVGAQI